MDIKADNIISVFYAKGIETNQGNSVISDFEKNEGIEVLRITEGEETYGMVLKNGESGRMRRYLKRPAACGFSIS